MRGDGSVSLGAKGWLWPDWDQVFYPHDMPPDWRLAFYGTQFDCVFLAAGQWQGVPSGELTQWAEDTHGHFLFLLEGADVAGIPDALAGKAMASSAEDARIVWFDSASDLKALAARLQASGGAPRFLVSQDGDLARLEQVRTLLGLLGHDA